MVTEKAIKISVSTRESTCLEIIPGLGDADAGLMPLPQIP